MTEGNKQKAIQQSVDCLTLISLDFFGYLGVPVEVLVQYGFSIRDFVDLFDNRYTGIEVQGYG